MPKFCSQFCQNFMKIASTRAVQKVRSRIFCLFLRQHWIKLPKGLECSRGLYDHTVKIWRLYVCFSSCFSLVKVELPVASAAKFEKCVVIHFLHAEGLRAVGILLNWSLKIQNEMPPPLWGWNRLNCIFSLWDTSEVDFKGKKSENDLGLVVMIVSVSFLHSSEGCLHDSLSCCFYLRFVPFWVDKKWACTVHIKEYHIHDIHKLSVPSMWKNFTSLVSEQCEMDRSPNLTQSHSHIGRFTTL